MKKTFLVLITTGLLFIPNINPVAAQTPATGTTRFNTGEGRADQKVANLKARADQEINRRLTSLNNLISRIASVKRLTADQKEALTGQVQTEITNLTQLKTKIDSDTDSATLKTDVALIVKSYRIYALFVPKIHILIASDFILDTTDKISSETGKLQTKITEQQSKGNDVASLFTALADAQAKTADAKTQAQNAQNAVLPLTPDGFPDNKTTLQSARSMLQTGHQDLKTARQDIKTIIQGLKTHPTTSVTDTPSATNSTLNSQP